eukprot:scaffold190_cov112-Isochrysis_galbana.AAC.4
MYNSVEAIYALLASSCSWRTGQVRIVVLIHPRARTPIYIGIGTPPLNAKRLKVKRLSPKAPRTRTPRTPGPHSP